MDYIAHEDQQSMSQVAKNIEQQLVNVVSAFTEATPQCTLATCIELNNQRHNLHSCKKNNITIHG